jgi:uncharacterized membrane protein YraQ (UPF0718 family)
MNITFELARILDFIFNALMNIIPFFIVSVVIAASINQFNFTQKLSNFFRKNIFYAVLIATLIGAISPLCACGVIPTLFALINIGIPLAPIMSFWITSPIMSPEAFMITWGNLGLELAIVRLIATIFMGIAAGYISHRIFTLEIPSQSWLKTKMEKKDESCGCNSNPEAQNTSTPQRKLSWKIFLMDVKKLSIFLGGWLLLAFFLEAIIVFYLPQEIIINLFGKQNIFSVLWAAIIGIPLYFNNISAIPIVAGLMQAGMSKGAALAFLLAGPITAVPAMVAVFGLVKKKVFITFLVIGFTLSVICGYLYEFISFLIQ